MQNTTTIMLKSRERQELLDQLAQTVEYFVDKTNHDRFDYAVKASIMGEVIDAINTFRTAIEAQLFSALGVSYTNTTYTAFNFIVKVPVPQFLHLQEIQIYYTTQIALLIKEMTAENVETSFIDDGVMGQGTNSSANPNDPKPVGNTPNNIYSKGDTWRTGVTDIITNLGVINAALMGDVPNVS